MAKREDKRSLGDRTAGRRGVPGRDRQVPAEDFDIVMPSGERIRNASRMNFGGLMGGLPTASARDLRRAADFYRRIGATDSAEAAESRARNVEGHERMTEKSKRAIALERRRAAVKRKRGKTGGKGHAKGGKVSCRRGDGICRQGRTKGKMR